MGKEYVRRVRDSFDNAARTYDSYATFQRDIADKLCSFVENLTPTDKVLDAGCGTGYVGSFIGEKCELYQLDISEKMCLVAQKKNLARLTINCDMQNMPFAKGFFSGVISSMAVHWANDVFSAFKSIISVCKKNGQGIFVSVPVLGTLEELDICNKLLGRKNRHVFYDITALLEMIETLGARVIRVESSKHILLHKTFFEFMIFLRKTGSHASKHTTCCDRNIQDVSRAYSSIFSSDNSVKSTWNIAYFKIRR